MTQTTDPAYPNWPPAGLSPEFLEPGANLHRLEGTYWEIAETGEVYLFAQTRGSKWSLIGLNSGNRLHEASSSLEEIFGKHRTERRFIKDGQ